MINVLDETMKKNKIRLRHIGRRDRLPKELIHRIEKAERETEENGDFNILLCLDYGGRDEILRAVKSALDSGRKHIDEKAFAGFLDTKGIPNPDLIIRTSGERRTSGFMPFQAVYAELYFTDKYFPEFDASDLREAVREFGNRTRRFGATAKKDLGVKK